MILNDIKTALENVDPNVYYGMAGSLEDTDLWDYVVFSRDTLGVTGQKTGYAEKFQVAIVREEFIPNETVDGVIDAMLSIDGMRLAGSDFTFQYTKKPNTNTVIELLVLSFMKPRKR